MNWKQFLKPDWRKIVIFVIITVLFLYLYSFTEKLNDKACYSQKGPAGMIFIGRLCDVRLLPLLIIFNPIIGFTHYVQGAIIPIPDITQVGLLNFTIGILIYSILTLPYYYLFSCLIVWIYDKYKKKSTEIR